MGRILGSQDHLNDFQFGRGLRTIRIPEIAAKEKRSILEYASDGLSGRVGHLKRQRVSINAAILVSICP